MGGRVTGVRKLAAGVARVALAGLIGGPLAALQEAGNQVIDAAVAGDRRSRDFLRDLQCGLEEFASAEGIPSGTAQRALRNARDLLADHALSAADLVALDLDAGRAKAELRRRGARFLHDLDDADRRLCEIVLDLITDAMLADPAALPEITREFQRAVLARAHAPGTEPPVRLAANAMLVETSWPWRGEQYPPSALLRAQYGVVPFHGRTEILGELRNWASTGPKAALAVYTGPGGLGKTRLLLEACRMRRAEGWRAGFIHPEVQRVSASHLEALGGNLLLVVDYAETRRPLTASLIEAALDARTRTRIVLLARAAGDWWLGLRRAPGRAGDFATGPAATRYEVPPLARTVPERQEIYVSAREAFATILNQAPHNGVAPDLSWELYDRVLFILLRALSALLGQDVAREKELLDFALRREQAFLDDGVRAAGLPDLAGRPVRQAAALATLAGGAPAFPEAIRLLSQVPLLEGQPAAVTARVAEILHGLYPSQTWLAGVEPDLLGEHLVATAIDEDPMLLGTFGAAH
jgi:hypothetical protein